LQTALVSNLYFFSQLLYRRFKSNMPAFELPSSAKISLINDE